MRKLHILSVCSEPMVRQIQRRTVPVLLALDAVTRERITDELWDVVKEDWEKLGYDCEAYEHSLQLVEVF